MTLWKLWKCGHSFCFFYYRAQPCREDQAWHTENQWPPLQALLLWRQRKAETRACQPCASFEAAGLSTWQSSALIAFHLVVGKQH